MAADGHRVVCSFIAKAWAISRGEQHQLGNMPAEENILCFGLRAAASQFVHTCHHIAMAYGKTTIAVEVGIGLWMGTVNWRFDLEESFDLSLHFFSQSIQVFLVEKVLLDIGTGRRMGLVAW